MHRVDVAYCTKWIWDTYCTGWCMRESESERDNCWELLHTVRGVCFFRCDTSGEWSLVTSLPLGSSVAPRHAELHVLSSSSAIPRHAQTPLLSEQRPASRAPSSSSSSSSSFGPGAAGDRDIRYRDHDFPGLFVIHDIFNRKTNLPTTRRRARAEDAGVKLT